MRRSIRGLSGRWVRCRPRSGAADFPARCSRPVIHDGTSACAGFPGDQRQPFATDSSVVGTGWLGRELGLKDEWGIKLGGLWLADTNLVVAGGAKPGGCNQAFFLGLGIDGDAGAVTGIKEGLREAGFIDCQSVTFDYRSAGHNFSRLPTLAAELIATDPVVIVTGSGSAAAVAAQGASSTILIVLAFGSEPVELGLAASLDRPGGNITGVMLPGQYVAERVKLLTMIAPQLKSTLRKSFPRPAA